MTEFAVQTGTSHHARRIDALVLENMTPNEPGKISIHGIEIKVDKSDLLNDHKMQEYLDFVDFFWIAVPELLVDEAQSVIADGWGILTIDNDKKINVAVFAKKRKAICREQTLESAINKLL